MELHIHKNATVKEVRDQFSRHFPFLRLEFSLYRRYTGDDPHVHKQPHKIVYLKESSEFFKEGTIYFSSSITIAQLEQEFQIELGLAAKIFRKSADSWVDTTQTAHLSLGKQNNMGAAVVKAQFNLHTLFL